MAKDSSRARGGGSRGTASSPGARRAEGPPKPVPANWPPQVTYLTTPVYAGLAPRQRQLLQTQPADLPGASANTAPLPEVPSILRFGPSPLVEIRCITDPAHPACGQRGLFAARHLPAGSFVLPYLGVSPRGSSGGGGGGSRGGRRVQRESDYDLWLDRGAADVAIDADRQGNEARFVNDYRGTGQARANAEFREVWDPRRGERGMAVFVLPSGKRALAAGTPSGGIAKGDEILVSYGKGFWDMRQKEAEAAEEKTAEATAEEKTAEATAEEKTAEATAEDEASTTGAAPTDRGAGHQPGPGAVTPGAPAAADVQYISDRIGSLKVVGKLPRNIRFA